MEAAQRLLLLQCCRLSIADRLPLRPRRPEDRRGVRRRPPTSWRMNRNCHCWSTTVAPLSNSPVQRKAKKSALKFRLPPPPPTLSRRIRGLRRLLPHPSPVYVCRSFSWLLCCGETGATFDTLSRRKLSNLTIRIHTALPNRAANFLRQDINSLNNR